MIREAPKAALPFAAAADALTEVDLVITVDTVMAHLAGAVGRPVWTLLSSVSDWRWILERTDTPWYPTMRLFRQPAPDDWASVFGEVRDALAARLAAAGPRSCLAGRRARPTARDLLRWGLARERKRATGNPAATDRMCRTMFGKDRIALLLGIGALVVTVGVGTCSTNGRFDDLNRRIDDLNDNVNRRFDTLRADHVRIDERLRAVEIAVGRVDQRLLTIERVVLPPEQPGG